MLVCGRDTAIGKKWSLGRQWLGDEAELYPVNPQSFGSSWAGIKQYLFAFSEVKALFLKTPFGAPLLLSGHKTCLFS